MKRILYLLLFLLIPTIIFAKDITYSTKITINNNVANQKLTDNKENTFITINKNDEIKVTSEQEIYGLYIIYELSSKPGNITFNNTSISIGENGYLHEYIDISKTFSNSKELTIKYNDDIKIGEIYILGEGELPEFVEIWEKPLDNNTDLLLLSTHSDDEQLFFLGLLPTYVARGANVQVVYFTNHYDNPKRLHELLHGLYIVGIRNYPIMGIIPDAYSESLNGAIKNIEKANLTLENAINFQVGILRRFKPSVVVGHDELGEYSHGQHILNTHTLKIALEKTNDETYHKESFNKYGLWNVPKTYIHLYKEKQIIMDYDTPLEYFNNKTAYEVSKEGYSKHVSQQWTWFTKWIKGTNNSYTKSTDIKTYSPNEFGLYRSLVGEDIEKNDMFENISYRKDQIKDNEETEKDIIKEIINNVENKEFDILKYKPYIITGLLIILIIPGIFKIKKNKVRK